MVHPELERDEEKREKTRREMRLYELLHDPRALPAQVRAECHQLVRCLAEQDYEEAALSVRADAEDPWTAERFEQAMAGFHAEYDKVVFTHDARRRRHTRLVETGPRQWTVTQVLLDPEGDNQWFFEGVVDLRNPKHFEGPLVALTYLGK